MTNDPTSAGHSSTDVEDLLAGAFDRALSAMERADLVDGVMRRIRARQRHRATVLMIIGFAAAVICVANALPLLDMAAGALRQVSLSDWRAHLPEIVTGLAVLVGGVGWLSLLLEETQ